MAAKARAMPVPTPQAFTSGLTYYYYNASSRGTPQTGGNVETGRFNGLSHPKAGS